MRKVIVSMNVSLDGFMAGPYCELDWHIQSWNHEMAETASEQLSRADTILLGGVTYRAMAAYWPMQRGNPCYPRQDIAFAEMMNSYKKVVFSKTMITAKWSNSKLVKGNIKSEIARLKKQPGKNIITYGSGSIVSALMRLNLVDEYQVWVHPVILGSGKPFFNDLRFKRTLVLCGIKTFSSGVVVLFYTTFGD